MRSNYFSKAKNLVRMTVCISGSVTVFLVSDRLLPEEVTSVSIRFQ